MSIQKIERLRKERKHYIEKYQGELDQVKQDQRYAPEYKQEKLQEIQKNLDDVKYGYDRTIRELIEDGKNEALTGMNNAEFDGADEKELIKKLLIETRNQGLANTLTDQYKDDFDTLMEKAKKEVNAGSVNAAAYISALNRVNKNELFTQQQINALEQTHKENTMNSKQRAYQREYQGYVNQETEYRQETEKERFTAGLNI